MKLTYIMGADTIFIAAVGAVFICAEKDLINNFGIMLTVISVTGMVCIVASFNKDAGECKKWHNIWKVSGSQTNDQQKAENGK